MSSLADHVEQVALVDHHVHGCWLTSGTRERFDNALNEANTEPVAAFDSAFDTAVGFAVRAHCAPLLDLRRHADPQDYWRRRCELGERDLAALFLSAAGVSHWLVDTGLPAGTAEVTEMAALSGGRGHEVVRLEQVAEEAAARDGDYAEVFADTLRRRTTAAVATKSILAYRGGFEGDLSEPSPAQVAAAAAAWRAAGGRRLTDRVLLRFGLHQALRWGLPLQLHVGLGDRDADLHRTNPLMLTDFLRQSGDVPIMLLHCYPFEREAGYLAAAFNNVYVDGGLSVNHLGAQSAGLLARLMELAPFRKVLYSSDGYGPPELHYLGARLWRDGIRRVTAGFVEAGQWCQADAVRVVSLIAADNARRVYGLP